MHRICSPPNRILIQTNPVWPGHAAKNAGKFHGKRNRIESRICQEPLQYGLPKMYELQTHFLFDNPFVKGKVNSHPPTHFESHLSLETVHDESSTKFFHQRLPWKVAILAWHQVHSNPHVVLQLLLPMFVGVGFMFCFITWAYKILALRSETSQETRMTLLWSNIGQQTARWKLEETSRSCWTSNKISKLPYGHVEQAKE